MNDFHRDNDWQKSVRDAVLAPGFYGKYSIQGRYVFLDKGSLAKELQRRAVDTIVQGREGAAIPTEEKIVRWPGYHYECFSLETHSCTKPGHESDGWMKYGTSAFLLWCRATRESREKCRCKVFCGTCNLRCHLIDFPKLQEWFWPREHEFPVFGPLQTLNGTKGRVVPIRLVEANVPTWRFYVQAPTLVEAAE